MTHASTEPSREPERKVTAATTAGGTTAALLVLVLWALGQWEPVADMPEPVKGALATLILGGLTALGALVAGWRTRHTPRPDLRGQVIDGVVVLDEPVRRG